MAVMTSLTVMTFLATLSSDENNITDRDYIFDITDSDDISDIPDITDINDITDIIDISYITDIRDATVDSIISIVLTNPLQCYVIKCD